MRASPSTRSPDRCASWADVQLGHVAMARDRRVLPPASGRAARVHLYDSIGNWVEDRVDMGFRIGAPPQDGLFARRLFAVQLIVCAAQAYLACYGMPRKLDDLANHQCSVFRPPGHGSGAALVPARQRRGRPARNAPCHVHQRCGHGTRSGAAGAGGGSAVGYFSRVTHPGGAPVPLLVQHMTAHMALPLCCGSRQALTQSRTQVLPLDRCSLRTTGRPQRSWLHGQPPFHREAVHSLVPAPVSWRSEPASQTLACCRSAA